MRLWYTVGLRTSAARTSRGGKEHAVTDGQVVARLVWTPSQSSKPACEVGVSSPLLMKKLKVT